MNDYEITKFTYDKANEFFQSLRAKNNGKEPQRKLWYGFLNFFNDAGERLGYEVVQEGYYLYGKKENA